MSSIWTYDFPLYLEISPGRFAYLEPALCSVIWEFLSERYNIHSSDLQYVAYSGTLHTLDIEQFRRELFCFYLSIFYGIFKVKLSIQVDSMQWTFSDVPNCS